MKNFDKRIQRAEIQLASHTGAGIDEMYYLALTLIDGQRWRDQIVTRPQLIKYLQNKTALRGSVARQGQSNVTVYIDP